MYTSNIPPALADTTAHSHVQGMLTYVQEQTGVDANTTFTILVTFLIFGFGYFVNWFVGQLTAKKARKTYKQSVNLLLYNFAQECKKNHELLSKSIKTASVLDNHAASLQAKIIAHLYFLEKIDYSVFLKHYVRCCNKEIKTKAVTQIFQIIGSVKEMEQGALRNMEEFSALIQKHQEVYLNNFFEIERLFERSFLTLNVVDYAAKRECIAVYSKWKPLRGDTLLPNSFKHLIAPLKDVLDRFPNEPNLDSLYVMVDSCYRAFPDLQFVNGLVRKNFEPVAELSYRAYRKTTLILKIFGYRKTNKKKK